MFREAAVPFVLFLVVGVGPGLAAPPNPYSLTNEELLARLIMNQVSLQQAMNESAVSFTSHGDELSQMLEDVEEGWRAMNQSVAEGMNDLETDINNINSKIDGLNQRVVEEMNGVEIEINNKIDAISQRVVDGTNDMETDINNKIDAINQRVDRWMHEMDARRMNDTQHIMEKLEAVQNAADDHHPRPGPAELDAVHNDSFTSLCDGHKVLYGGHGYLAVTSNGNYSNNLDCSWTVTLPEGTRPVFRWRSNFNIEECPQCTCDFVYVQDVDHDRAYYHCGDNPPDGSFLTIMNNKFEVWFHSDGSGTGQGFKLNYRSVLMD